MNRALWPARMLGPRQVPRPRPPNRLGFHLHLELKWHLQAVRHREFAQALSYRSWTSPASPTAEWARLDDDPARRRRFVVADPGSEMHEPQHALDAGPAREPSGEPSELDDLLEAVVSSKA